MADIRFRGMIRDPSITATIERWLHRLEVGGIEVRDCEVAVERIGARHEVHLAFTADGYRFFIAPDRARTLAHRDAYVAVSDAFRSAWRRCRGRDPASTGSVLRVA
jgi:hypothetical protein